jgi:hypothetical protein
MFRKQKLPIIKEWGIHRLGPNRIDRLFIPKRLSPKQTAIKTTLYELIGAINEEIPPEDDWLVTDVVLHLLNNPSVKLLKRPNGDALYDNLQSI